MTERGSFDTKKVSRRELRSFGLVVGGAFAVLFGILSPWLGEREVPMWPFVVAGLLWACALVAPGVLAPVHRVWMVVGHALGWVNTRVILAVMFFLVVVPTAVVLKLMGKDPMKRNFDRNAVTYRTEMRPEGKERMENPY